MKIICAEEEEEEEEKKNDESILIHLEATQLISCSEYNTFMNLLNQEARNLAQSLTTNSLDKRIWSL